MLLFRSIIIRRLSTIYALSSGYGKCGVAIIRVSGPHSGVALKTLTNLKELPKPRYASLRKLYDPLNKEVLDKSLVVWFPGPNSFTGEDCCEFQVHGSIAIINSVLNALNSVTHLRPAEAGEFTRRAFHNAKMDLIEVEGFADLLQAETEMQRKQALLQADGALSQVYHRWRTISLKCVASIEAQIDFEENELLDSNTNDVTMHITQLHQEMMCHLEDGCRGEILRNGVRTVIIGAPNVGKSSLLNHLCKRPAAIVTPIAGTTRDLLQVTLDINGYPIQLVDTAGLRETTDLIEKEGIQRALNAIKSAHLAIFVADIRYFLQWQQQNANKTLDSFLNKYITDLGIELHKWPDRFVIVLNKCDLIEINEGPVSLSNHVLLTSCETGDGLESLKIKLSEHLKHICGTPSEEHPCMSKERHRHLIQKCAYHLEQYIYLAKHEHPDVVILAQYLRFALRQLGKLTGNITTEDVLNVIFQEFCIGK